MWALRVAAASNAALAISLAAINGSAQTEGKALAEALFRDGRALLEQGRTDEACKKFASSYRIEHKLGTLLNLATCHEAQGKIATAWAEFTEAAVQAERTNQPERQAFAREHADALYKRLSRVSIVLEGEPEATVKVDNVQIDRAALGSPFPIDPGEHVLTVTAPGKARWAKKFVVPPGPASTSVSVPVLEAESAQREPRSTTPAPLVRSADTGARPDRSTERMFAFVMFGVGAVGVGVGSFYGLRALSTRNEAEDGCDGEGRFCSNPEAVSDFDRARMYGNLSTIGFGVGIVAIAAGTYLFVSSAPDRAAKSVRPRWTPAANGIGLRW
jgi:hypothetical protein